MERSILTTIKVRLPIEEECEDFDNEIIPLINTQFLTLLALGVGPKEGFRIEDDSTIWSDYFDKNSQVENPELLLAYVEDYIYTKVKLVFDPPASTSVIEIFKANALELENRIRDMVEVLIPNMNVSEEEVEDE